MSMTAVMGLPPVAADGAGENPMGWLLQALRQSIEEMMAAEVTPLHRAGAVARLGNLYLKACGASELKRENKAQAQRIEELEARVDELHAQVAALSAGPSGGGRLETGAPTAADLRSGREAPDSLNTTPALHGQAEAAQPVDAVESGAPGAGAATPDPPDPFRAVRDRLLEILSTVAAKDEGWLSDEAALLGVDDVAAATARLEQTDPRELVREFEREFPRFDLEQLEHEDPGEVALALLELVRWG